MTASLNEWLPKTFTATERTADTRLTGFRFPPPEDEIRRIAKRPIEPLGLGGYYGPGNGIRLIKNSFTLRCREIVERIDALSAWEGEGGR